MVYFSGMGVLSKTDILKHFESGNILIDPFHESSLANSSYDVRLGKYYFRQQHVDLTQTLNPFWEKSVRATYSEVEEAQPVSVYKSPVNPYHNLKDTDLVILVAPGETILAHTIEFIGGRNGIPEKNLPAVTTEMRARSSIGRLGIAVCKCAGWGDIGYVNRWTMEITNFSNLIVPLPVGLRVAQIIFHGVTPIQDKDRYHTKGKYQTSSELSELKKAWKPEDMLPKLYKDPDLGKFDTFY